MSYLKMKMITGIAISEGGVWFFDRHVRWV